MKSSTLKQPEELFYLISPSQSIAEFVANLKEHVEDILGHQYESRFSPAHVSLLKDSQEHAEGFLYDVEEKISTIKPFIVPVKNLKVFWQGSDSRTIYLDIEYKTPICEIFEILAGQNVNYNPYITVAKNLKVEEFLKVWKSLKGISYSNDFMCNHLTVLKRSGRGWAHHVDLSFGTKL